jgi:hypothetical protein
VTFNTPALTAAGSKYQFPSYLASFAPSSAEANIAPDSLSQMLIFIAVNLQFVTIDLSRAANSLES